VSDRKPDEISEGPELSDSERAAFQHLLDSLSQDYNFDFHLYKDASLIRRIQARMRQVHADSFESYLRYLQCHADEPGSLFNTILINVTGFYRDAEAWDVVRTEIMPPLLEAAATTGSLRIWSAGCSTGEEAYTMAIVLAEAMGDLHRRLDIKIYATDIDEDALLTARQALYRIDQLKDVPERLLNRYFMRDGQLYRLRRELRRWCIFGRHNLVQDPPLSHVDFLLCRNVLIYFKSDLQDRLLPRFHYAIREGGYLFLGKSEALMARSRNFAAINIKWRIFQRIGEAQRLELITSCVERNEVSTPTATDAEAARVNLDLVLNVLPYPIMVIDPADTVLHWNEAAESLYGIPAPHAIGRQFRDLDISYRVEGLRARLEDVKHSRTAARLNGVSFTRRTGETVHAEFWILPLSDGERRLTGLLVAAADVTASIRLRDEIGRLAEQHATATEELQSTNEELETTNEELQSTNEELETTNEELQSTNEELMTTVDELQAANTELSSRTSELRRLANYHESVINSIVEALVVLDRAFTVNAWSHAAERIWGLRAEHAIGRDFFALPIGEITRLARGPIGRIAAGEAKAADGFDVDFTASGADGEFSVRIRFMPLMDNTGELKGIVATARRF
jgi:two-component system, chemotaxis family, CheB/CheR fusion protein